MSWPHMRALFYREADIAFMPHSEVKKSNNTLLQLFLLFPHPTFWSPILLAQYTKHMVIKCCLTYALEKSRHNKRIDAQNLSWGKLAQQCGTDVTQLIYVNWFTSPRWKLLYILLLNLI